ncbi:hypothetical protein COB87_001180 [Candidatus Wolfebacteria bacterium]|nr:hypothetical protein [Candidatus Wolfebacteria bacterium]
MGKYNKWNRGEDEALLNKLGGEQTARDFLSGKIELVKKSRLNSVLFSLPKVVNPPLLRQEGDVWLSTCAHKLFVDCEPVIMPACEYSYWDFPRLMNDSDILREIGHESIFKDLNKLSVFIKHLQKKQPKGEKELLLRTEQENIFYVYDPDNLKKVLYVSDTRSLDHKDWDISIGSTDSEQRRFIGNRVFRNCINSDITVIL